MFVWVCFLCIWRMMLSCCVFVCMLMHRPLNSCVWSLCHAHMVFDAHMAWCCVVWQQPSRVLACRYWTLKAAKQQVSQPASHFLFDMCHDVTLFISQLAGAVISDSLCVRERVFLTESSNGQEMDVLVFMLHLILIMLEPVSQSDFGTCQLSLSNLVSLGLIMAIPVFLCNLC